PIGKWPLPVLAAGSTTSVRLFGRLARWAEGREAIPRDEGRGRACRPRRRAAHQVRAADPPPRRQDHRAEHLRTRPAPVEGLGRGIMAKKADFTEQEWGTLQKGVMGAGVLVSVSDRSFFDSFK